jgi:hyperosmotically inducible periplasmic protein
MKKVSLVALTLSALLAGCSTFAAQRTPEFQQADTNHDEKVELVEWMRFGGSEASFLAADVVRRGYLDEAQFRQALSLNDEATGGGSVRRQKVLDGQIMTDARRALEQSRDINAWNIIVEVYQGNVTLSGPVRTSREKQTAERIASGVMGVKSVFNQLVIRQ